MYARSAGAYERENAVPRAPEAVTSWAVAVVRLIGIDVTSALAVDDPSRGSDVGRSIP